jgi:glycosyltransferase involved in cell wall biosynthesis
MVSSKPVPTLPKVEAIYPPKWLVKILGVTPARLLTFLWSAMRRRPHIVGGFHIIPNGIGAAMVGRLAGARSMYFSVGGPTEVLDGGGHIESKGCFRKMETPDLVVEKRLLHIISRFDLIITMGTRAIDFFCDKGIKTEFQVISGGIDSQRFQPSQENPSTDLILTGRLVPIKRIDIFIQAVKYVADMIPEVKAVIVGDGELHEELQCLVRNLGIEHNVQFTGYQKDVENWLQKSKIFVLTSDVEGLALSMMEAMMCGLPAVVSDVGDLGDLVEDGINGYLVPRRCPEKFAARMIELLDDENKLKSFSRAARASALEYSTQAAIDKWNKIIKSYRSN